MKRIITLLIALCASIVCLANETNIAKELAKRIIPNQAGSFKFVQTSDTSDVSELSSKGGKIIISGNNACISEAVFPLMPATSVRIA